VKSNRKHPSHPTDHRSPASEPEIAPSPLSTRRFLPPPLPGHGAPPRKCRRYGQDAQARGAVRPRDGGARTYAADGRRVARAEQRLGGEAALPRPGRALPHVGPHEKLQDRRRPPAPAAAPAARGAAAAAATGHRRRAGHLPAGGGRGAPAGGRAARPLPPRPAAAPAQAAHRRRRGAAVQAPAHGRRPRRGRAGARLPLLRGSALAPRLRPPASPHTQPVCRSLRRRAWGPGAPG
ncbi:MAG: hypothetical protein J3K34DRAFT_523534, partial [Monoraphidium minutum]